MTITLCLILAVLSLLSVVSLATAIRALRDFSSHELEEICKTRKQPEIFSEVLRDRDNVVMALENLRVIGITLFAGTTTLAIWFYWQQSRDPQLSELILPLLLVAFLQLAFVIWIPHTMMAIWAEPFLFFTWRFWYLIYQIARPLVFLTRLSETFILRMVGKEVKKTNGAEAVGDEIRDIVTEGHHGGQLEDETLEMIESVIEMGDIQVFEVMTPRTDMISFSVDLPWDELVSLVIDAGHTRIPVYNKNRDDIIGLLHSKDLLGELAKPADQPRRELKDILRTPYFVPETKAVIALLQEFRKSRNHIAVVLDEYGGVSGLVSIEDVLEEIVGEIADEYDDDLVDGVKEISDSIYEVHARLHIYEVNQRLGLSLPETEDFDTLGGLVFHELGRIPAIGEELVRSDVRIRVLDATRRRIDRVTIERITPEVATPNNEDQAEAS